MLHFWGRKKLLNVLGHGLTWHIIFMIPGMPIQRQASLLDVFNIKPQLLPRITSVFTAKNHYYSLHVLALRVVFTE